MPGKRLSVRLPDETFDRLDAVSRRMGQSRSYLAKTLLEEGLRMENHPGIVFRTGPAGRRPALIDGPDVWEFARLLSSLNSEGDALITQTAKAASLTPEQERTALRYCAEFKDEIDSWVRAAHEEAERAEAECQREQELLRR